MRFRYKVAKVMSLFAILAGSFQIYGIAGSSDLGVIGFKDSIINCMIGIAIVVLGIIVLLLTNMFQSNYEKRMNKKSNMNKHSRKFIRDMALLEVSK